MSDLKTEIRSAFENEQGAFPPPPALRRQIVNAVSSAPERIIHREQPNLQWLAVAAAALVTVAIVAGFLAIRLAGRGFAPARHVPPSGHGWIAFRDGSRIAAVDPDNAQRRTVLGTTEGADPIAWSRDGSEMLLHLPHMFGGDLYVWNVNGVRTRLTYDLSATSGSFSPDGAAVAYSDRGVLFLISAKGGSPRSLARGASSPSWSPDGSRIAFFRSDDQGIAIWVVQADGSGEHQVAFVGPCDGAFASSLCPRALQWTRDGSKLGFLAAFRGSSSASQMAVYVVGADGSGLQALPPAGEFQSFAWSPDGKRIALTTATGELALMPAGGGDLRVLQGVFVYSTNGQIVWGGA